MRDAAGFDDMAKQTEIGEIESHDYDPAFGFSEVRLPISLIVPGYFNTILRERRNHRFRHIISALCGAALRDACGLGRNGSKLGAPALKRIFG
jgi:hypothetical protein